MEGCTDLTASSNPAHSAIWQHDSVFLLIVTIYFITRSSQRIAHGTLIFSVAIGMTAGSINPRAMSYGYDRLRFIRPVFIGDTIRVTASIADKRDHPKRADSGIVAEKIEVMNQRNETVLVCEHLYLVQRRDQLRVKS